MSSFFLLTYQVTRELSINEPTSKYQFRDNSEPSHVVLDGAKYHRIKCRVIKLTGMSKYISF